MRLPGFAAERSLYRAHGYETVGTHRVGIGSHLVQVQMVLPPGGPPRSVCEVFPWLCPAPVDPCVLCANSGSPKWCCICGGSYWNGYQCI